MRDQDLSNEALIPKVIELNRLADVKTTVEEAETILSNLTNSEKISIVITYDRTFRDPTDV